MRRNVKGGPSKATVITRDFAAGDLQALAAISRRSPEAAQWRVESYGNGPAAGQTIFLAEVEGQIQGFLVARFVSGEAEILNMAVDPSKRREGIGRQLLTAAFAEALAKKTVRIYLEVRESNQAAIGFYSGRGFARTGIRRNYYSGPTENAVLMERKLTAQD
jgi:ribosomal-protein-alanine N-acetyltransferase